MPRQLEMPIPGASYRRAALCAACGREVVEVWPPKSKRPWIREETGPLHRCPQLQAVRAAEAVLREARGPRRMQEAFLKARRGG